MIQYLKATYLLISKDIYARCINEKQKKETWRI
jgi:hypothetical protein